MAVAAPTNDGRRSTALLSLFSIGHEICLGSSGSTSEGRTGALKACTLVEWGPQMIKIVDNMRWVVMSSKESFMVQENGDDGGKRGVSFGLRRERI